MFLNLGGLEIAAILIVALVVLGPTRLPDAFRQVGRFIGEAKKLSSNFQNEVNEAMNDPVKKVTGIEGASLDKLPKNGKELMAFAVPEPFAAQKKVETPQDSTTDEDEDAEPGSDSGAADLGAQDPHSPEANGYPANGIVANGVVANAAIANAAVADGAAANSAANGTAAQDGRIEPAAIPPAVAPPVAPAPSATSGTPPNTTSPNDDDADSGEVPMFGDR